MEFSDCQSMKIIFQSSVLVSEKDQICFEETGSETASRNIEIEKVQITQLKLIGRIQNLEQLLQTDTQNCFAGIKILSCNLLENDIINWKILQNSIPHLHSMEKLEVDVPLLCQKVQLEFDCYDEFC